MSKNYTDVYQKLHIFLYFKIRFSHIMKIKISIAMKNILHQSVAHFDRNKRKTSVTNFNAKSV